MIYILFITYFICHYLADYILQSDEMAKRKANELPILAYHSLIHFITFFVFNFLLMLIVFKIKNVFIYIFPPLIIFITHFIIDFITSKLSKKWYTKDVHIFYLIIGFDQFLHYSVILSTIYIIMNHIL